MTFHTLPGRAAKSRAAFLFLTLSLLLFTGCRARDAIDKAVAVLDKAIETLQSESADWRAVLEETRDQLVDEAQSTIRNEVSNVLTRAVAASGAEFRCDVDFVRTRVRQDLIRIRATLLQQPVPEKEPALCAVNPLAVDASLVPDRLPWLEFYGYDFDAATIQVLLDNGSQSLDVSQHLDKPTHYHMTLNLGTNGVPLSPDSRRFILKWKDQVISSITISQAPTPTPQPLPTTYEITLATGCVEFGDSNAHVFITLFGSKGSSQEEELSTPDHDDRERCQRDIYRIFSDDDLGELQLIRIRHDNAGGGPGWFLDEVVIRNLRTGQQWDFPCNRWLAVNREDGQISREIQPGGPCQ